VPPHEHEFLHSDTIIPGSALGLFEREIVLPQLVWRWADTNFRGTRNDTVTMRIPAYLEAREYTFRDRPDPIELDDLVETGVDVKLDTHLYSAVALTDEHYTLDLVNFSEQVTGPQSRAMARKMEQVVADGIENAPHAFTVEESDPYVAVAKARAELNKALIPQDGRVLIVGADVEIEFLKSPLFVRVDTSGSDSALRDAQVGRVAGSDLYTSMFLQPDSAYLMHRSAIALANVAPEVPDGVTAGGSQNFNGYAVRWIRDYDAMYLRDRSVLSAFMGVSSVDDGKSLDESYEDQNVRICKIEGIGG